MRRLTLLLAAVLGVVAYRHWAAAEARRLAPDADAFPFPTAQAHERIVIGEAGAAAWCEKLGCSEAELHAAIRAVGQSAGRVREYLAKAA